MEQFQHRRLFEYQPILGYRFIPGLRARIRHESGGYLIRVNESGFRCDHSFVLRKKPGFRRVLLFGDSMTAGDGVSNGKRFGDLLEKAIPNLEVYNFGLPGTGTDQHFLVHREYATGIDHDLLMIAVLVENIQRNVAHFRYYSNEKGERVCYAKPYYEIVEGKLKLRNVPVPKGPISVSSLSKEERRTIDQGVGGHLQTMKRLILRFGLEEVAQSILGFNAVKPYGNPNHAAWTLMSAILKEWIMNHDKPVLLVPIPMYYHIRGIADPSQYQARFQELALSARYILHDPLPDFLNHPSEERDQLCFKGDRHFTPEGHALLAESITASLLDSLENKS